MINFNPNNLDPNDKDWIEEVSDNWQKYLPQWLEDYRDGKLEKQDIINVVEKIIEYKSSNPNK